MRLAGAVTVAAIIMIVPAGAEAETRWAHLRVEETSGSRTRISVNLPLTALRAMTKAIHADHEARLRVSDSTIRMADLRTGWLLLRAQPAGSTLVQPSGDGEVRLVREADGMSMTVTERWSSEETIVRMSAPVADALLTSSGTIRFSELANALATTNGAPLAIHSTDGTVARIWVDSLPEGAKQ